jgi:hypothetical protein
MVLRRVNETRQGGFDIADIGGINFSYAGWILSKQEQISHFFFAVLVRCLLLQNKGAAC